MMGRTTARTETTTATMSSSVLTIGLPTPAVDTVTIGRAAALVAWTPPASSNPAASDRMGWMSVMTWALPVGDDVGAAGEQDCAGGRAHEGLDAVVDAIDRRYFVGDDLDHQQHGDQANGPPAAEQVIGRLQLNQRIAQRETRRQSHHQQRDVGVQSGATG